jgi:hypothetical protein
MFEYFMAIGNILQPFGILYGHLLSWWYFCTYIFPVLVHCMNKNLATLVTYALLEVWKVVDRFVREHTQSSDIIGPAQGDWMRLLKKSAKRSPIHNYIVGNCYVTIEATSLIIKKLPKVNNRPIGEN